MTGQLVQYGRHRQRRSYARISEVLELPNLIEIQTSSYQWFLDEGLREMFQDISPIEDFTGNLSLEFIDYSLGDPKYPVAESKERDVQYCTHRGGYVLHMDGTTGGSYYSRAGWFDDRGRLWPA